MEKDLKPKAQLMNEEAMHRALKRMSHEILEQNEGAEWIFRYAGSRMDLTQTDDDLGLTVLKGIAKSIDFDWKEGESFPNILHVKI